ncbi:MAG TPA: PH domain-containing protein [Actinomycetota bacterium]|nr:PH domain-containing protein [Actinomycetota bacterium]
MGPDRKKQFLKKNPDLIPSDEDVQGVVIAEVKGGAWRRGITAGIESTGVLATAAVDLASSNKSQATGVGDAGAWPEAPIFWVAITDKQLHAFEGKVNSQEAGPAAAHYPLDRIASFDYQKKMLISKFTVAFRDGSSIELDITKQKVQPFIDAVQARSG